MSDKKQAFLVANCLRLAGKEFSRHTCDDIPNEWLSGWTCSDVMELGIQLNDWNRSSDDYDPFDPLARIGRGMIMEFLASKIEAKAIGMAEDDRSST